MSCSSCGCNPCNEVTCDASNEPLASALNNFITAFFGSLTKTCVNDQVVWVLPCDLDSGVEGYPRVAGEGLACYILRIFNSIDTNTLISVDENDTTPGNLIDKLAEGTNVTLTIINVGGDEQIQISASGGGGATGEVSITGADTTDDFLDAKLTVGAGLSKTVVNPGGVETLNLVNTGLGLVVVTGADTTPAELNSKVTDGTGINLAVLNPGANEILEISSECLVFVSATDTAPAFLDSKVIGGNEIAATILNPGGVEQLEINYAIPVSVAIAASNIDWSLSYTFRKTLGANTTFTFSNTQDGKTIIVAITNTAGNFTATWPAAVQWTGGVEPVLTTGAKTDVFTFVNFNGTIYGSVVQNMS